MKKIITKYIDNSFSKPDGAIWTPQGYSAKPDCLVESAVYICDQTGEEMVSPKITLMGFSKNPSDGGILIPSSSNEHHFSSREAFIAFMKQANGIKKLDSE